MKTKTKDFENAAHRLTDNREVENARAKYELLKKYARARSDATRKKIWSELGPDARRLVVEFGVTDALRRLSRAIDLDASRPRNISLYQFAGDSDLDYIGGEFSTYNKILFDMERAGASSLSIKHATVADMKNRHNISAQYADDIIDILAANKDAVRMVINVGMGPRIWTWTGLLTILNNEMCKKMGIRDSLSVMVLDDWDCMLPTLRTPGRSYSNTFALYMNHYTTPDKLNHVIYINRRRIYESLMPGPNNNIELFVNIISSFAHEFGHFVDTVAPNKGALGAQKQNISAMLYTQIEQAGIAEYKANPTEASSKEIEFHVANALKHRRDITD